MRLLSRIVLFVAAALLLGGCAADLSNLIANPAISPRAGIDGLKGFDQEMNQCGAAALATVLSYVTPPGPLPEELESLVYTPEREGSFYFDLAREMRLRGLLAYSIVGGLSEVLSEVSEGRPVIVLENRGLFFYEVMHWSVVGGHDMAQRQILLYEGKSEPSWRSLDTFSRTFERSGRVALLALPSGELPYTPYPQEALKAIDGLEQVAGSSAALPFYRAFISKYPDEWMGRFGLGNALYATGDRSGARREFLAAIKLAPSRPEPQNNLAMLAIEAGEKAEALRFASEAVRLADYQGVARAVYANTLSEISAMPEK